MKSRKSCQRGAVNVIATMLIFGMMIASMGVLYALIAPTLFGFEAESETFNQEFVFLSIGNAVGDLASSADQSQTRVKIISQNAIYNVNDGQRLQITFIDDLGTLTDFGSGDDLIFTSDLGYFNGNVSGNFGELVGESIFGKISNEDSFITTNETLSSNYVIKAKYTSSVASFSLYFKTRIFLSPKLPNGEYDLTILTITITFAPNFVDFPVDLDEWSLRLRRQRASITSYQAVGITGNMNITHSVDGVPKDTFSYDLNGEKVNVKFIEIPILFSI